MRSPGAILLVSTYELGHPPHGVALLAASLRQAGFAPRSIDVAVESLPRAAVRDAKLIVFSTPMHTALRLALDLLGDVQEIAPQATVAFVGLYAALHRKRLRQRGVAWVFAGELETSFVERLESGNMEPTLSIELARQNLSTPNRHGIDDLSKYSHFVDASGQHHLAGYTETTRGCLERCHHCPVPAVYNGRFVAIDGANVLKDIANQVEAGARHITFGDPDFLNGPTHALRICRELHNRWPELTFDFTAQVANLLEHREVTAELTKLGCAFVVTAVESLSDRVLEKLNKRHRRADVTELLRFADSIGLALRPTLVPFTPWTRPADLADLTEWIEKGNLEENVAPVQLSVRLLVPPGSLILESDRAAFGDESEEALGHQWSHIDPAVDELAANIAKLVSRHTDEGVSDFDSHAEIRALVGNVCGIPAAAEHTKRRAPRRVPRVSEPWFC